MTALPTLPGGQNASVIWMNDSGEGVGYSENGTPDSDCIVPFQVRRFAGAKWTHEGKIQELRPLPGDTVSFAFGINDRGQTVGVSGLCSNVSLPGTGTPYGPHATLWDSDGSPVAIGTLPTGVTTMPTSINNRGEVVGNVQFPDGSIHPFLWSKQAGMRDLGVAAGDFVTIVPCCGSISNRGEMVGFSCGPNGCRAVVYSDQGWVALNKLTLPGSPLDLQFAVSINDAGQIAGWGATADGDTHAFLVRPAQTKADGGRKDEAVTSRSIQLDGTQSTSADGKDLTYVWTIPRGYPSAAISGATTATPTVQFSLTRGTYVFKLTVIDSTGTTSTDLVTVNFVGN